jgi:hypothetical protein
VDEVLRSISFTQFWIENWIRSAECPQLRRFDPYPMIHSAGRPPPITVATLANAFA